jgi:multidrug efflux pump subunit AcrA (membrane-fusion protein)
LSAVLAFALLLWGKIFRPARTDLILHTVKREPIQLTIVERGTLESADNCEVVCHLKAGTKGSTASSQIKWVIDDGSYVKQGQLLMELDDSGFQDQLKTEKITVDGNLSAAVQAEEAYKIVLSQNQSDIQSAKNAIELARLDLEKYQGGDYPQSRKDILGRIKMAESDVAMQKDRAAWAQRMVIKGYLTTSQAQAEQSHLESNDIALKKVQEELYVLDNFTAKRTEIDLRHKLDEAKAALERTEKQATAKEIQAETDRQAKKSIYLQELARYQEIEDEIHKCIITAPQDGMVVYYVSDQARSGAGTQQGIIAQGEMVREGQKLMRIPDLRHMVVNTKVHEALVSQVKGEVLVPTGFGDRVRAGLLTCPDAVTRLTSIFALTEMRDHFRDREHKIAFGGQRAVVRADAFPEQMLKAHVKSVATVSAQQDWLSADVKVYQTMIAVDEPMIGLKPGMSAEVTIIIDDEKTPVLTVPVQAIVGTVELGKSRKVFVLNAAGEAEGRMVTVGLANEKIAEIKSGLEEGDQVVLNPRVLMGEQPLANPTSSPAGAGKDQPPGQAGPSTAGPKRSGTDALPAQGPVKPMPKGSGAQGQRP